MIGFVYFLIALGMIVIVHELGHLIVAKRNGVYCHEFSIGMGPRIKKLGTDKTGTVYSIRAIPIGGYVMMAGEDDDQAKDKAIDPDQMLSNKSAWVKIKVLFAGSAMNVVLAIFLMMLVGFFGGVNNVDTNVVTVKANSPASQVGIKTGDRIETVNGQKVAVYQDIVKSLSKNGQASTITYQDAQGTTNTVEVSGENTYGILPEVIYHNVIKAFIHGFTGTYNLMMTFLITLKMLFSPEYGIKDLAGFIGIYRMSSEVIKGGFVDGIRWIAYLSINIGFLNILPIPALDGGRLVFAFYELIFRRRANKKFENFVTYFGVILMFVLFIFITYNDIIRIITK